MGDSSDDEVEIALTRLSGTEFVLWDPLNNYENPIKFSVIKEIKMGSKSRIIFCFKHHQLERADLYEHIEECLTTPENNVRDLIFHTPHASIPFLLNKILWDASCKVDYLKLINEERDVQSANAMLDFLNQNPNNGINTLVIEYIDSDAFILKLLTYACNLTTDLQRVRIEGVLNVKHQRAIFLLLHNTHLQAADVTYNVCPTTPNAKRILREQYDEWLEIHRRRNSVIEMVAANLLPIDLCKAIHSMII